VILKDTRYTFALRFVRAGDHLSTVIELPRTPILQTFRIDVKVGPLKNDSFKECVGGNVVVVGSSESSRRCLRGHFSRNVTHQAATPYLALASRILERPPKRLSFA
jgi:hypothetical protein